MTITRDKVIYVDRTVEKLIIKLLMQRQEGLCADCDRVLMFYQVHHERYGVDITIDDLKLLCSPCHGAKSGQKLASGTLYCAK